MQQRNTTVRELCKSRLESSQLVECMNRWKEAETPKKEDDALRRQHQDPKASKEKQHPNHCHCWLQRNQGFFCHTTKPQKRGKSAMLKNIFALKLTSSKWRWCFLPPSRRILHGFERQFSLCTSPARRISESSRRRCDEPLTCFNCKPRFLSVKSAPIKTGCLLAAAGCSVGGGGGGADEEPVG